MKKWKFFNYNIGQIEYDYESRYCLIKKQVKSDELELKYRTVWYIRDSLNTSYVCQYHMKLVKIA